ncbi:MAG: hypothetical protein LBQ67_02805 [Treponema sp.]|jgi:hypothetical protein|nr:hypothetical protein [Treponema sp.]
MAHYTDWLPTTRERQPAIARDRQSVMGTKAAAWGIPAGVVTDLGGPDNGGGRRSDRGAERNHPHSRGHRLMHCGL